MRMRISPNLLVAIVLALLALAACGTPKSQPDAQPAPDVAVMTPEPEVLAVTNVQARPSPLEGGTGAVYLTVLNGLNQPLTLTGATGDVAKSIEMHETINDQGVMRMEPRPEGFAIPAGTALELKPGGKHIMLMELAKPLVTGDVFKLTLHFDNASELVIDVPVGALAEPAAAPASAPVQADLAPAGPTLASQNNGELQAWLTSTPAQPIKGEAQIDAYLVGSDGQPITDAKVTFDIDMTNMSHGQYLVDAQPAGDGHYAGRVHFSMPGPWRIIAIVERPGHERAKLRFEFRVDRG